MTQIVNIAAHNKQLLQAAYAELLKGNRARFRELYADDVTWTTIGTTQWSKTYAGKPAIREMFERLAERLDGLPVVTAQRFIAEDEFVVVEGRGQATTKAGKPYNNTYCMVYRLADGKVKEMTEYCDTALINDVL